LVKPYASTEPNVLHPHRAEGEDYRKLNIPPAENGKSKETVFRVFCQSSGTLCVDRFGVLGLPASRTGPPQKKKRAFQGWDLMASMSAMYSVRSNAAAAALLGAGTGSERWLAV
jgi:hypothetical protein